MAGTSEISDMTRKDEKNLNGKFHCEISMLSLRLLHKTQAARKDIGSEENINEGISSERRDENSYLLLPS